VREKESHGESCDVAAEVFGKPSKSEANRKPWKKRDKKILTGKCSALKTS
jgi:hypothetical protein